MSALRSEFCGPEDQCALCYTPSLTTGRASRAALNEKPVRLFSDLLLHRMGPRLADDIVQSVAGPCEFRTASLWGLGQRIFLLHDGRTTDLVEAIEAHASRGNVHFPPSEANAVIRRFRALGDTKKQDMLDFLRVSEARTREDPRIGSDPKSVGISGSQAIQLGSAAPRCWPLLQHAGSACHLERDPRGWCALSCTEVVAICCLVGRFGWSARETVPDRSRVALGSARAPSVERSPRRLSQPVNRASIQPGRMCP